MPAEMLKVAHNFCHDTYLFGSDCLRGFDETEARNFTSKTYRNKYKENHCIQQSRNQYISEKEFTLLQTGRAVEMSLFCAQ